MPVIITDVGAVGANDAWSLGAGANKVVAVNLPDDSATSYITDATNGHKESYTLATVSVPAGGVVTDVSVTMFCARSGAVNGSVRCFLLLGGNTVNGTTRSASLGYQNFTETLLRPGGGSWASGDFTTLEVGVEQLSANGTNVSTLSLNVTYIMPTSKIIGSGILGSGV